MSQRASEQVATARFQRARSGCAFATGFRTPRNRRLGLDVAGEVEAVGSKVTRFRPGNEVFGDIVNWDFIPEKAIRGMTLMPSNPVFGLNAIGGAISIEMKNGFN